MLICMSTPTSRCESTERVLVGALTALVIARFLIKGNDPGRLDLTSGGGPLTLNLLSFALLFAWSVRRAIYRVPFRFGPGLMIAGALLFTAIWAGISTAQPDRYRHPGPFIAWDWAALAALVFTATQLLNTPARQRGMIAVIVATGTCVILQSAYGRLAAASVLLPSPVYVERSRELDDLVGSVRFSDPWISLLPLVVLLMPATVLWARQGWRQGGISRFLLFTPLAMIIGIFTSRIRFPTAQSLFEGMTDATLFGTGYSSNEFDIISRAYGFWFTLAVEIGLLPLAVLFSILLLGVMIGLRTRATIPAEGPRTGTPWEFYGGGIAGLLLGMILATGDIPAEARAEELLRLGAVAAIRSAVWFFLFSLMEAVDPGRMRLRLGVIVGLLLSAAACLIAFGAETMTIQQPFWLMLLLALPLAKPSSPRPAARIGGWVLAPITLVLIFGNLLHVGYPGLATAGNVRRARQASVEYPYAKWKIPAKPGPDKIKAIREAKNYLEAFILQPLRDAVDKDPGNVALMLELARWQRDQWNFQLDLRENKQALATGLEILSLAEKAAQLDPRNKDARWSVFESLLVFTRENTIASKGQLAALDKYIALLAADQPHVEVELRYRVLKTILPKQNQDAIDVWTVKVLELESVEGQPHGRLSDEQRKALTDAVRQAVPYPSGALQEWLTRLGEREA